ncbi:MAG TPA: peptide-methionine (S)-S-oxide reductase, partial [Methyloceanibacter sp.]|nr:peptide-methionine (S)-S-oxide reductase [Methyloceanibacter sp.]
MTARWICAALTAAFLAVIVLACGSHETRAAATETAIFAGGCFWCVEDAFDQVDGVTETVSGYAGGTKPNPNYGSHAGYQEALKVTYDPAKVTYAKLLDHFWRNIDPFDANGQFC